MFVKPIGIDFSAVYWVNLYTANKIEWYHNESIVIAFDVWKTLSGLNLLVCFAF